MTAPSALQPDGHSLPDRIGSFYAFLRRRPIRTSERGVCGEVDASEQ